MRFLDRLVDERIEAAVARGELDNLPGMGKPIREEYGMEGVPEDLRMAYRVLKNAGYLPEELVVRRAIADASDLLLHCEQGTAERCEGAARLRWLFECLGTLRSEPLWLADDYHRRVLAKIARQARSDD